MILEGKRILVTRAREQASALSELLREEGAEPVEFPVIKIVPPISFDGLDAAIRRLPGVQPGEQAYDWVVFTSANGVRFFVQRLTAISRDARAFGSAKIAAIGSAAVKANAALAAAAANEQSPITNSQ